MAQHDRESVSQLSSCPDRGPLEAAGGIQLCTRGSTAQPEPLGEDRGGARGLTPLLGLGLWGKVKQWPHTREKERERDGEKETERGRRGW